MTHLDRIHRDAYDYARTHGATPPEARDIADGVTRATLRIAKHVITQTGFTPHRWKP